MSVALRRRALCGCARYRIRARWHDHLGVRVSCHDLGVDVVAVVGAVAGDGGHRPTQGSRMKLAGDDPEHVIIVPGGLLTPTAKAGSTAAIGGDEIDGNLAKKGKVAGRGAMAHPAVTLTEGDVENPV